MIEITASDIFWIGAMDKIEIGLIVMFLFALFLVFMAVDSSSVAIFLFALLLGIFSRFQYQNDKAEALSPRQI